MAGKGRERKKERQHDIKRGRERVREQGKGREGAMSGGVVGCAQTQTGKRPAYATPTQAAGYALHVLHVHVHVCE